MVPASKAVHVFIYSLLLLIVVAPFQADAAVREGRSGGRIGGGFKKSVPSELRTSTSSTSPSSTGGTAAAPSPAAPATSAAAPVAAPVAAPAVTEVHHHHHGGGGGGFGFGIGFPIPIPFMGWGMPAPMPPPMPMGMPMGMPAPDAAMGMGQMPMGGQMPVAPHLAQMPMAPMPNAQMPMAPVSAPNGAADQPSTGAPEGSLTFGFLKNFNPFGFMASPPQPATPTQSPGA